MGDLREFVAGGLGGVVGITVCQPLDMIKVRLQSSGKVFGRQRSNIQIMASIAKKEALSSLWKGMSVPLYSNALQNAFVFHAYSQAVKALASGERESGSPPLGTVFASGCIAGAAQALITTPVEHVKIRSQMQRAKPGSVGYVTPRTIVAHLARRQGFRGVFSGLAATVLRDTPSYGVYFFLYDFTRELMTPNSRQTGSDGPLHHLLAGGVAGVGAWASIYPVDVVKTRIQASELGTKRSFLECAREIHRENGVSGFGRGFSSCLLRAFMMNSVIFAIYEFTLKLL
ncbi:mitochondrial carrier protein [Chloropicon primus]|uniref:Mitochondrial carrier protein n=1 Tax=Chloropicon primus TaxID=1764295 RepID=A0A5B8MFY6_9CHLO|nr:mitochondrial carrier protein [Chloropicon primus]UPQ98506.1 mitochondrial carrier protein [Chloropicon primus]|eukprot:QDZ19297.1 mitochondrial carrier protein [Chloropicon primus]